jgi:hypothetical protein
MAQSIDRDQPASPERETELRTCSRDHTRPPVLPAQSNLLTLQLLFIHEVQAWAEKSPFFICVANCRSCAMKAVLATESVRSRR